MIIASNVNSVCVDDWRIEWAIIASNVNSVCVDDWTAERMIIASNTASSFAAFIQKHSCLCDFSDSSGYVREDCDHREWREELQCDGLASRVGGSTPSSYIKVQITVHLHTVNTYTSKN